MNANALALAAKIFKGACVICPSVAVGVVAAPAIHHHLDKHLPKVFHRHYSSKPSQTNCLPTQAELYPPQFDQNQNYTWNDYPPVYKNPNGGNTNSGGTPVVGTPEAPTVALFIVGLVALGLLV